MRPLSQIFGHGDASFVTPARRTENFYAQPCDVLGLRAIGKSPQVLVTIVERLGRVGLGLELCQAEQGGGGITEGVAYAMVLTELTTQLAELETLGVQLKDFERGLVDFPSLRDGRVVLLCWQLGEGDELEWWHDVDAGFAGRTPL